MAFRVSEDRVLRCLSALAPVLIPSGSGLPGAEELRTGERLAERMSTWSPSMARRIRALVLAFELGPVGSKHRRAFSRLSYEDRVSWVESL